jgi:hypothetical protein
MTLRQTERLLALLRANGVTHFKCADVEVTLSSATPIGDHSEPLKKPLSYHQAPPAQAAPPVSQNIPHHVNEVAALLKLDDASLVDRLFPDYTQPLPE